MEHSYFKDRISAYHDRELKHEERQVVEDHLKDCAECRDLLEQLQKLDAMVERHSGLNDDDYWERSAQRIERAIDGAETAAVITPVKSGAYRGLWWKVAGAAASVAIIAFIALYEGDITRKAEQAVDSGVAVEEGVDKDSSMISSEMNFSAPETVGDLQPLGDDLKKKGQVPEDKEMGRPAGLAEVVRQDDLGGADSQPEPAQIMSRSAEPSREVTVEAPANVPQNQILRDEGYPSSADSVRQAIKSVREPLPPGAMPEPEVPVSMYREATPIPDSPVVHMLDAPAVRVMAERDIAMAYKDGQAIQPETHPEQTLDYWQQRRDSLVQILSAKGTPPDILALADEEASDEAKVKRGGSGSVSETDTARSATELNLLQCYFMVADMTSDDDERSSMIAALKTYAGSDDAEIMALAKVYLAQLEADK